MLNYKDYVYAVYREGSFSKAAKSLYVSQPWLSTTIKKAEQEFGISIFNRSTTPISLTESGKYYIAQIEKILQIEHEMQEYFFSFGQGWPRTSFHRKLDIFLRARASLAVEQIPPAFSPDFFKSS